MSDFVLQNVILMKCKKKKLWKYKQFIWDKYEGYIMLKMFESNAFHETFLLISNEQFKKKNATKVKVLDFFQVNENI